MFADVRGVRVYKRVVSTASLTDQIRLLFGCEEFHAEIAARKLESQRPDELAMQAEGAPTDFLNSPLYQSMLAYMNVQPDEFVLFLQCFSDGRYLFLSHLVSLYINIYFDVKKFGMFYFLPTYLWF
jgi:hypothetical protein